jgi:FkbM family methyltransferase
MKRGAWILNLIYQVLKGDMSLLNGLSFGLARIQPKPVSIYLKGIRFDEVDHTFWGILADIFLNRVYLRSNFGIGPKDIVVDIGAHRGGFTSFAAVQTSNKVIAFEPDPVNFTFLEKHIKQNHLQNVIAHNAAIGSQSGKSNLFRSIASSRHSLYQDQAFTKTTNQVEVKVISLDEALANLERVHFLKMDCEGAEFDILMHAERKTLNKIEKLAMETHDPIHSQKIEQLCDQIKLYFPHIRIVDQKQDNLGYLYAWKSDA